MQNVNVKKLCIKTNVAVVLKVVFVLDPILRIMFD